MRGGEGEGGEAEGGAAAAAVWLVIDGAGFPSATAVDSASASVGCIGCVHFAAAAVGRSTAGGYGRPPSPLPAALMLLSTASSRRCAAVVWSTSCRICCLTSSIRSPTADSTAVSRPSTSSTLRVAAVTRATVACLPCSTRLRAAPCASSLTRLSASAPLLSLSPLSVLSFSSLSRPSAAARIAASIAAIRWLRRSRSSRSTCRADSAEDREAWRPDTSAVRGGGRVEDGGGGGGGGAGAGGVCELWSCAWLARRSRTPSICCCSSSRTSSSCAVTLLR